MSRGEVLKAGDLWVKSCIRKPTAHGEKLISILCIIEGERPWIRLLVMWREG